MPTDANGVYSLPDGYLAVTGATIQASQHNPALDDIAAALTARLPRSGTAPMTGPLRVQDGNSSEPSIAFASDPSAGFYLSAGKIVPTKPLAGVFPIGLGPLPWSRMTAPAGWVLCYGQTLSRVTYADLWAVAQIEIAAGNPFYTNGDGSTTFGIGDARGYAFAGADNIGGTAANRLTGYTPGFVGGASAAAIVLANLPPYTPSGSVNLSDPGHAHGYSTNGSTTAGPGGGGVLMQAPTIFQTTSVQTGITVSFTGNAQGGSSTPLSKVQPTLATNAILYAGA